MKTRFQMQQNIFGDWETIEVSNEVVEEVNSPKHYTLGGIETIDYIEAKNLPYHLGNVIKYVSRCGHKAGVDPMKDLKKAQWYLNRYIKNLEANNV